MIEVKTENSPGGAADVTPQASTEPAHAAAHTESTNAQKKSVQESVLSDATKALLHRSAAKIMDDSALVRRTAQKGGKLLTLANGDSAFFLPPERLRHLGNTFGTIILLQVTSRPLISGEIIDQPDTWSDGHQVHQISSISARDALAQWKSSSGSVIINDTKLPTKFFTGIPDDQLAVASEHIWKRNERSWRQRAGDWLKETVSDATAHILEGLNISRPGRMVGSLVLAALGAFGGSLMGSEEPKSAAPHAPSSPSGSVLPDSSPASDEHFVASINGPLE